MLDVRKEVNSEKLKVKSWKLKVGKELRLKTPTE
jgi:hypothetical protein